MGSCVSRSPASAGSVASTAKVIGTDGSMARLAAPVTARDALGAARPRFFLCSSDELRFDAPARALAADEPLQPGRLYFALPLRMLRRPLSGQEMAALAVKASSALAASAGVSPPPDKNGVAHARDGGKRRKAGRVAPLAEEKGEPDGGWNNQHEYGERKTAGRTRKGVVGGYRSGGARRRAAAVQRLSAIPEASDCE